ncbi:MAG: hypothetical protein JO250_19865 [Armatimonadetes bacterium]|nr:hypothetical protein [Armatimonadota bacterium]
MRFIKHTEVGKRFLPRVSMSKDGLISFSDAATKRYSLDKYQFIVLYYDPQARHVGIEPVNDENAEGAIKLRQRDTGAYAAGKSFVGKFDIVLSATNTFDLNKDEETGFLYFDLNRGTPRNTGGSDTAGNDAESAEEE